MSRVSIVIPMFNEARHIGRTLLAAQAAAHQAQLECELIVVDNGSDDHGPRIANELGARVLIVPGVHIGALRNRGAAVASGEWLAFIDADIEMPADWLKLLVEMEGRQGDVLGLDLDTPRQAPWFAQAWQRRSQRPGARPLHRVQWLPSANLLMRRTWFEQVGGFDESLRTGEDKDFSLRLRQAGAQLLLVNESLALHWGYEGSWLEWMSKELWRQGSHWQLLRSHGPSLRLLRFPALSMGAWCLDLLALAALLQGQARLGLTLLLVSTLPALLLSLRQSQRDPRLTLQLWALHGVRLHLTGAALLLNLCQWNVRRPARG
ncbi:MULTISPECIES: glycosyltransferase [Pseudomonas]|jgi:GT2 family glycosyltransferase|uniref:Glycosyl transferase family 2 n=1 Tax=Pseudomonas frederiksbergensis TaxID=104087 RepID=A0A0B1Z1E0_9PSED|nr:MULTISPECIES: glycosyltransferase [Pseudomonas]KHK63177.1 glycosyl transferase family 2 [Pseudomonas frederiksbergensis]MBI6620336.1 glycosyltransferase [Pseudomonas corrugata]MBI6694994.1 glycosyltransferase [Pseudomonas corrugata]